MKKNRWIPLLVVFVSGITGVMFIGVKTYQDAPPRPDFKSVSGNVLVTSEDIVSGQAVFMKYALMNYGSMFGDGAGRGNDFTAEALHVWSVAVQEYYKDEIRVQDSTVNSRLNRERILTYANARCKVDMKKNTYDPKTHSVAVSEAQRAGITAVYRFYEDKFLGDIPESFKPSGYLTDATEIRQLTSFFIWGAWTCSAVRPGNEYSYTHNWPYDELAGNVATGPTLFWSMIGVLAFVLGLGIVLYAYGRFDKVMGLSKGNSVTPLLSESLLMEIQPTALQRSTYKFFVVALILLFLQCLAGALTIHDFLGFTTYFGVEISTWLPVTVVRSWHLQLALLWITLCWIGASVFILPMIAEEQSDGQITRMNVLFWSLVALAVGSLAGEYLGPMGLLGTLWYLLGNQGWEFVELGKLWQVMLFACFGLWAYIMWMGAKPFLKNGQRWTLPVWLFYAILCVLILFIASFVSTPTTNFVIADFWRWITIHMWVEAFFEVFTTILVASFMVIMGLSSKESAIRVVYISAVLFLGSGMIGVAHNFYWNAKPEITLALGSVFSTLQTVPLMLLTLEAWRTRQEPIIAGRLSQKVSSRQFTFAHAECFMFLLAVNFWNFMGAGVMGSIINLPIVNYYEHGTYLTVNHGHAALMGVYGNLAIAAVLFCTRYLVLPGRWNVRTIRMSFWSINIGLGLMVLLDLLPLGLIQLNEVLQHGLWYARSEVFIASVQFQAFSWMRAVGGVLFVLGGVYPLMLLMIRGRIKPAE